MEYNENAKLQPWFFQQMGSSMRKIVFTEGVVEGLKKWRRKAKKNIALRNDESARPSLDASLDYSPSFNTLDTSLSIDTDQPSPDTEYLAVEISEEETITTKQPELNKKLGSFEGFDLTKTS